MSTLESELREILAHTLGVKAQKIFVDKSFVEQSIGASELCVFSKAIQRKFNARIPNLLWEYPSIQSLCAHLTQDSDAGLAVELSDVISSLNFQEGLPDVLFYE